MVLLSKITEDAIVDNLKKRYMDDYIFVSYRLNEQDDLLLQWSSANIECSDKLTKQLSTLQNTCYKS